MLVGYVQGRDEKDVVIWQAGSATLLYPHRGQEHIETKGEIPMGKLEYGQWNVPSSVILI